MAYYNFLFTSDLVPRQLLETIANWDLKAFFILLETGQVLLYAEPPLPSLLLCYYYDLCFVYASYGFQIPKIFYFLMPFMFIF